MENSKVQVTDLHKYYGKLEVLKGIDMTVKQGEVVSLICAPPVPVKVRFCAVSIYWKLQPKAVLW